MYVHSRETSWWQHFHQLGLERNVLRTLVFSAERFGAGKANREEPSGFAPSALRTFDGQATKGTRRMPWHQEAKKGVVSCDKLRGAASKRRSEDTRMGQPNQSHVWLFLD
jgi:hypothetical protein